MANKKDPKAADLKAEIKQAAADARKQARKLAQAKKTPWFDMSIKPVRPGKYEAKEKRNGGRFEVYWRKLEGNDRYGWYTFSGYLTNIAVWQDASPRMAGWRGLAEKPAPVSAEFTPCA